MYVIEKIDKKTLYSQSIGKVIHYRGQAGESQNWNQSEWKLLGEKRKTVSLITWHKNVFHRIETIVRGRWSHTTRFPGDWSHLHTLKHIQEVVHASQMLHILENGNQQSRCDGDGAGQKHSGKSGPLQVQETLVNTGH